MAGRLGRVVLVAVADEDRTGIVASTAAISASIFCCLVHRRRSGKREYRQQQGQRERQQGLAMPSISDSFSLGVGGGSFACSRITRQTLKVIAAATAIPPTKTHARAAQEGVFAAER